MPFRSRTAYAHDKNWHSVFVHDGGHHDWCVHIAGGVTRGQHNPLHPLVDVAQREDDGLQTALLIGQDECMDTRGM